MSLSDAACNADADSVCVPAVTALDPGLSTDALGVLVHLLACSRCDSESDLFVNGVVGRGRARTTIASLIRLGYYKIGNETVDGDALAWVRKASRRGVFGAPIYLSRVYFVERDGLIKIGTTTRLSARLRELSRDGVVTLLAARVGGPVLEAKLHRRFVQHHVGNEWFRDCRPIRSFLVQSGGAAQ